MPSLARSRWLPDIVVVGRWVVYALGLPLIVVLNIARDAEAVAPKATGIRFGVSGTTSRLVIDLDRRSTFDAYLTTDRRRLVIDLPEVDWRLGAEPASVGLLRRHRHAAPRRGSSRVTAELAAPAELAQSRLLAPSADSRLWRLVVDLTPLDDRRIAVAAAPPQPWIKPVAGSSVASRSAADPPPPRLAALPSLPTGLAASPTSALPVLVLDPGHGGIDPGAIGINGGLEKNVVLAMARALRDRLVRDGRYRVVMTRDDDRFLRLSDRVARTRTSGAALLISIHADSAAGTRARGPSVFTLSTVASDEETARLAGKENRSDNPARPEPPDEVGVTNSILIELAKRDTNSRSIAFADFLTRELAAQTGLAHRQRRFGGFAVLRSLEVPSVLLELGYLSDRNDAGNLARDDYRARTADVVARAVDRWLAEGAAVASDG